MKLVNSGVIINKRGQKKLEKTIIPLQHEIFPYIVFLIEKLQVNNVHFKLQYKKVNFLNWNICFFSIGVLPIFLSKQMLNSKFEDWVLLAVNSNNLKIKGK